MEHDSQADGILDQRPAYYDDPDGVLGLRPAPPVVSIPENETELEHARREARERTDRFEAQKAKWEDEARSEGYSSVLGPPTNAGAYADIERRTSELVAQGLSRAEATRVALTEDVEQVADRAKDPAKDYLGASVASLMRPNVKVTGSSSGGGRTREAKKGTWICNDCHLEFCHHRPKKERGAPRQEGSRSQHVTARVSMKARDALRKRGIANGVALEAAAIALTENIAYGVALARVQGVDLPRSA